MKHSKPSIKHNTNNEFTHFDGGVFGFKNTVNEVFDYNLNNISENGLPVWAETIKREKHWQQDPTHDSPTIKKVEYSDGFGRILQTRAQAEDILFGADAQQRKLGNSGLPADQNAPNQPAVAVQKGASEGANVVVSGWKVYNNKGKVVEEYEPFYDKKFDFKSAESFTSGLVKMSIRYDAGDRPTETLHPDGSISLVVYGTPDQISNPPLVATNNKNAFTPSPWTRYNYDQNDLGSITNVGPYTGAYTPNSETVDALGRTVKTTQHNSQPTSNPSVFEDVVMKYEYDVRGNLIRVIDSLGRIAFTYHYDLRPAEKDENGDKQPLPPLKTNHIDSGISHTVFDVYAKPIQSKDAKDAESLIAYDRLQRDILNWSKNNAADQLRLTLITNYGERASNPVDNNLNGKLWEQYDGSGKITIKNYDFKGNLLSKKRNVISSSVLKSALDNYEHYLVDWTGLPSILDSFKYVTDNQYDALDRITKLTLPENVNTERKEITPFYNRSGALESVSYDNEEYVKHIAYNAKGQRLLIAFGNDVMTRYSYDINTFRLLRRKSEKFTYLKQGATITYNYDSGTNKQDDGFQYDLVGNILKILSRKTDCGIAGTQLGPDKLDRTFTYDPLYRLRSATGRESDTEHQNDYLYSDAPAPGSPNAENVRAYTRNYRYDKLGNIERMHQNATGNSFTRVFNYQANNNKLEAAETGGSTLIQDFEYDQVGNQLKAGDNRYYVWDAANQMLSYYNQAGTGDPSIFTQYDYDSGGERVSKLIRTGSSTSPIYERVLYIDGVFEFHKLENDTDTYEKNYVHVIDDKSRIAMVRIGDKFPDDINEETTYILEDQIGSSVARLNTTGSVIDREEYYPFGDSSLRTFTKKRFRYTGKEKDAESGLYYYGARYYSAWTCRFISIDPKSAEQPNFTPYLYANNNPIRMNDPSGMQAEGGEGDGSSDGANDTTKKTEVHKNAYYKSDGTFLGYGTGTDNEVYIADSVTKNEDGTLTFENAVKIDNITHTEFAKSANIINHESSGNREESLWIAHAANNAKEAQEHFGKHENIYGQLTAKYNENSKYSSVSDTVKSTPLSVADNSSNANNARAALLDVLSGGPDPTGGAVLWDGTDLLRDGVYQNKFKEANTVLIHGEHFEKYKVGAQNFNRTKMNSTLKRTNVFLPANAKKGSSKGPGLTFRADYGWQGGNFHARGKRSYNYETTGSKGASIFWKTYK